MMTSPNRTEPNFEEDFDLDFPPLGTDAATPAYPVDPIAAPDVALTPPITPEPSFGGGAPAVIDALGASLAAEPAPPADPILDDGMMDDDWAGAPVLGGPAIGSTIETPPPADTGFRPLGEDGLGDASVNVSVPRVTIHIYGERADTLAAAERAGQDRRMARATTQIRTGGLQTAIETYRTEPTPALIMVETDLRGQELLTGLDTLADVCDAGTKVVVIGAANDIALYRELMRRGVSEYLVAPLQPLQLIAAIGGLFTDPARPFVGRSIAFVGARGGVGSSTIAHNTAYALAERVGANTVIVDYDLPFGTAGLDFNQDPLHGVADALGQPDRLDSTLLDRLTARCTDRLSLFAAPATLDADWQLSAEAVDEVTQKIRSTAPFVVLDLPHLWSSWMKKTLITADEVVIVAVPDLASLRNAKNMIDLIKQARPNDAPPRLVLNQAGLPGRPEIPTKEFGAALGVHPSLVIPFDAKLFGVAANNGQMIVESAAKTKPAEAFLTLAQIVSQREIAVQETARPGGKSLFAGLMKKKKA